MKSTSAPRRGSPSRATSRWRGAASRGPFSRRPFGRGPADPVDVYSISGVRRSALDDQRARRNRYLWSMGVRTLCFGLAIVSTGPARWVFIAGAVLLPYIAVVFANAGRERMGTQPEAPDAVSMVAIEQSAPYDGDVLHPGPAGPVDGTSAAGR